MVRGRIAAGAWYLYLALGAAGTACYFFAPWINGSGLLFNALGLSSAVAVVAGARMHRPQKRLPWYLFALAQVFFVTGDVMYYTLPHLFGYHVDFPSTGDIFYITVYPLIIAGLLLLVHARNPRRDLAALIDALIIGVGVGVVSWVYLMVPYAQDEGLPLGTKTLSIAYPLMDVLVLAVMVRLTVDSGRRPLSFYLLVSGLPFLVAADTAYGFIELNGTYTTGDWLDVGWLVYYFAWGAAALHPSMRLLSQPVPDVEHRFGRGRLLLLAAATLMAPVVQLTRMQSDQFLVDGVLILASMVLFALVVVRLQLVVRQREDAEGRERTLREAGATLVSAPTSAAICVAAIDAARALVGGTPDVALCTVEPGTRRLTVAAQSGLLGLTCADLTQGAIPAETWSDLEAGVAVYHNAIPAGIAEALVVAHDRRLFAAPLVKDRLVGLLLVASAGSVNRNVRDAVTALASQVALALEAAGSAEDMHRRQSEARFRSLVQNSSDMVTVVAPNGVVQYQSQAVEHILGYEPASMVGVSILNLLHPDDRGRVGTLLAGVAQQRQPRPDSVETRLREATGAWRFVEMMCTDLTGDPNVGGVVLNTRDISERKQFEEQLTHQAFHDPVTGLANRALFKDRVQHALHLQTRNGTALCVMFLDLDDFKTVNDSLGHGAGDELLTGVGERLRCAVRSSDTVARLGGDEFALLLEHVDTTEAITVAEAVLHELETAFVVAGRDVFVRASVGIAVSEPAAAPRSADDVLRDADVAMYMAKERGKGRYELFEPQMHTTAVRRLELKADLQRSLENGDFVLHYQPIFDVRSGRVHGVEALVRWMHPVAGIIAPDEFIPLAEETGLIVPIGTWVVQEACRQARTLRSAFPAGGLTVAVNLSARQLQQPDLVEVVMDAISASGIDADMLAVEITESLMMRDANLSADRLQSLRELGVGIAVDDFGTGYSSLKYLRQFPLDILKVDRAFVQRIDGDPDDRAIARAIVQLARVLMLRTVAEGIETPEQLEQVRAVGCDFAQGFHLARPMDAAALMEYLGDLSSRERSRVDATLPEAV